MNLQLLEISVIELVKRLECVDCVIFEDFNDIFRNFIFSKVITNIAFSWRSKSFYLLLLVLFDTGGSGLSRSVNDRFGYDINWSRSLNFGGGFGRFGLRRSLYDWFFLRLSLQRLNFSYNNWFNLRFGCDSWFNRNRGLFFSNSRSSFVLRFLNWGRSCFNWGRSCFRLRTIK